MYHRTLFFINSIYLTKFQKGIYCLKPHLLEKAKQIRANESPLSEKKIQSRFHFLSALIEIRWTTEEGDLFKTATQDASLPFLKHICIPQHARHVFNMLINLFILLNLQNKKYYYNYFPTAILTKTKTIKKAQNTFAMCVVYRKQQIQSV